MTNKWQVLTPDSSETIEFDIVEESLQREVEILELAAAEVDDDKKIEQQILDEQLVTAQGSLADYHDLIKDNERPALITIGFMPPGKRTEFELRARAILGGKKYAELDYEKLQEYHTVQKATCQWGVKGFKIRNENGGVEYTTEDGKFRTVTYKIASQKVADLFEMNTWLDLLQQKVLEYNRLGKDTKKK